MAPNRPPAPNESFRKKQSQPTPTRRHSSSPNNYSIVVFVTAAITWRLFTFINGHSLVFMIRPEPYERNPNLRSMAVVLDEWKNQSAWIKDDDKALQHLRDDSAAMTTMTVDSSQNTKAPPPFSKLPPRIIHTGPSRVWAKFEPGFPCFPGETTLMETTPAHEGFLFQRPTKVGGTTMVGVILRLVHNQSPWLKQKQQQPQQRNSSTSTSTSNSNSNSSSSSSSSKNIKCRHRTMHGSALSMEYDKRDHDKSFLLSMVRHPTQRAISEFFHFGVACFQVEPTDERFLNFLQSPALQHKYLLDLSARNYTQHQSQYMIHQTFLKQAGLPAQFNMSSITIIQGKNNNRERFRLQKIKREVARFGPQPNFTRIVQDILDDYNFIAVTERMDESLVVMQMLLNLTTKDILYTRARNSGSFSNGGDAKRPCVFIPHSYVSPNMKTFFESNEWQHTIRGDLMLYEAAQASLDRTIEALGRKEFEQKLKALKAGLELAQNNCKGRVRTQCTEGGVRLPPQKTTCYIWGEGCDHECINELDL